LPNFTCARLVDYHTDLFEEPARYVTSHLELLSSLLYTLCGAAMMEVQNKYELFYN